MDMDAYGNDEYGHDDEEDDGMDENWDATGEHVAELHHPRPRRQLKQEPRWQQDEQDHGYDHRTPVCRHVIL